MEKAERRAGIQRVHSTFYASLMSDPPRGFVDRPDRGLLSVAGRDRLSFLHAILTNDIARLEPGAGCYAAYLTPQGRMISDMIVMALADEVWLDVPAAAARPLAETFDRIIFTEDVRVGQPGATRSSLEVLGGEAAVALAEAVGGPPARFARLAPHHTITLAGEAGAIVVARDAPELGPAFTLHVDPRDEPSLRERLAAAGATPLDPAAFDVRRIEAGLPRFGVDMDEDTLPLEARIEDRAISFTKGCYPGQEVIIRVLHRGHGRVARLLVGLLVDGEIVPAAGDPVVSAAAAHTSEPRNVGTRVTSAAFSPALGRPIALAYVPRDLAAEGTAVMIDHAGGRLTARVARLPFVARESA